MFREKESLLVAPVLAVTGNNWRTFMNGADPKFDMIRSAGNPNIQISEGTPQFVYDSNGNIQAIFYSGNPHAALKQADQYGLILGKNAGFTKATGLKELGQILGYTLN